MNIGNISSLKRIVAMLILFSFFFNNSIAQLTEVVSNIAYPTAVYKNGNLLYYGSHNGSFFVKNLDIVGPPETLIPSSGIYRVAVRDSIMYVSHIEEEFISIVDISNNSPQVVGSITGITSIGGLAIKDNYLYGGEWYSGQIIKIDLLDPDFGMEIIATGVSEPTGLAIHNDKLFICEWFNNRILSLDISQDAPELEILVEGLNAPTEIVIPYENTLWVSDFYSNAIKQIDISESPPTVNTLIDGIAGPTGLCIDNNELYLGSYYESKIYVYNTDFTPPVCNTQNISIQLDEYGLASINTEDVNYGSYDNIEIDTMYLNVDSFDSSNIGINTVSLTVVDSNGNMSSCNATVTVEALVSIQDETAIKIELAPNPANNFLHVNINSSYNIEFMELTDCHGKVLIKRIVNQSNAVKEMLDISQLSKGIYFLRVQTATSELIKKVMKF